MSAGMKTENKEMFLKQNMQNGFFSYFSRVMYEKHKNTF